MERDNDLLSRVLRRIPGFRGYVQQEDRQQSEEQTRQFVKDQLRSVKDDLERCARSLADKGLIMELAPIDALRERVESVRRAVDRPVLGSAGLLGVQVLDENDLENLYDVEANLMDRSVELSEVSKQLTPSGLTADELRTMEEKLAELVGLVERRKAVLDELKN